jgi:asparagine synthase (glutamine-hydrolysing)
MPGIAGVFTTAPSPLYEHQVRRMVATLRHQVDSESGIFLAPELGVYAGWLAHAGSFAARQCAEVPGSSTTLVFAGECFGRDASAAQQYAARGDGFIAELNGLFAGLLIDREQRHALLFNDRFGSERLYTFDKDGAIYFASEAKALLAVLPELRAFDDTGVAQWLAFGSTLGGRTLFRGITLMPGGSIWRFAPGAPPQRQRYFEPAQWEALPALKDAEFEAQLSDTFGRLLPDYLAGAQPVGLSLTGGLDTRMIAACLPRDTLPAVAYTYAAEGNDRLLDLKIARSVAAARGIPHQALRIGGDFLAQFARHLDRTVWISDGTAGVLGAHELPLSEQARALAPVRLTGNFGSEVLRSMSTFKRNGPGNDLLDAALASRVDAAVAEQRARAVHPVTHAAFEEVPWHLFGTLAVGRSQLTFRTPFMDQRMVELAYRAPPPSRLTAAPSLRLIHDHDPALARLPTDRGVAWGPAGPRARWRRLGAELTFKLDYWHKEGLADGLTRADSLLGSLSHLGWLGLHKFLAYRLWFRGALAPYAEQVIADARTRALPFWNPATLRTIAHDHASGRRNRLREIHAVLTLEAVQRLLIDDNAYRDRADTTA